MTRTERLARCQEIVNQSRGRTRTPAEEGELQGHLDVLERDQQLDRETQRLGALFEGASIGQGARRGRSLHGALLAAGWQLGGPPVRLPIGAVLIDDPGDAAPLRDESSIIRQGADSRRLFPVLERRPLNGATRIDVLVSTGRVLANPEEMQLPIAGSGEKPITSSGAELQSFDVGMVATVSDPYPNSIVELEAFRDLVDDDMTVAFEDSLDNLVVATITLGAGTTDDPGGDLLEQLRRAVTAIQGAGFAPSLAAVSPEQAEQLDLTRAGSGGDPDEGPFLLTPSPRGSAFSPLWDLQLRVVKGLEAAVVLDPGAVRLYVDDAAFDSDPYSQFSTNRTRFRVEAPAVLVVRRPMGIYVIASVS